MLDLNVTRVRHLTCDITEELLIFRRRELRDPVILSSRNRCPVIVSDTLIDSNCTDIEAISASDRTTKLNPMKFQMYAQNRPANPPSINPCVFAL